MLEPIFRQETWQDVPEITGRACRGNLSIGDSLPDGEDTRPHKRGGDRDRRRKRKRRPPYPPGPWTDHGRRFIAWLHGPERETIPPFVAFFLLWPKGLRRQFWHYPGSLPYCLDKVRLGVYMSVCLWGTNCRREQHVVEIPACWVDLDPPKDLPPANLRDWAQPAYDRLVDFAYPPSAVVFSGRGLHVYWKFDLPLSRNDYEESEWRLVAERVKRTNRALMEALGGDAAFDLARVLRLPGSINAKTGQRCKVVEYNDSTYDLRDLSTKLGVDLSDMVRKPRVAPGPVVIPPRRPRQVGGKRGRPSLLARAHDLRSLPPWVRLLVKGGVWATGARFRKAGGLDRSRGDLAAVGALLRAGWSEEQIFAGFQRADWFVGDKYREIARTHGEARADEYLARTIARARMGLQRSVEQGTQAGAGDGPPGPMPEPTRDPASDRPDPVTTSAEGAGQSSEARVER